MARFEGNNYFITFNPSQIDTNFYGPAFGGQAFIPTPDGISPPVDWPGFGDYGLTSIKFWEPYVFVLDFNGTGLASYTRSPDLDFEAGTSTFNFSDSATAELFASTLSAIGEIRSNATLCAPFIQNFVRVGMNPVSGSAPDSVNIYNTVAVTASASGSSVILDHSFNTGLIPSNGDGTWKIQSEMTYQTPVLGDFGSLSYANGVATLTLSDEVAAQLATELAAAGGKSFVNDRKFVNLRANIPGVGDRFIFFEGVSNFSGSGFDLTFNYEVIEVNGDFGPPLLYIYVY